MDISVILQLEIIEEVLMKVGRGCLEIVLGQKWQPAITNYGDCFG